MALSSSLLSQFAKLTVNKQKTSTESTVNGTTVIYNGKTYVKFDGSDLLTPVNTTSMIKDGDRVTVLIKNHTATVTGNASDPSASSTTVNEQANKIDEFGTIVAHKVTADEIEAITGTFENITAITGKYEELDAINADIENLKSKYIETDKLNATDIEAINADIENLEAKFAEIDDLTVEELEAINAEIANLKGYTADFTYVSADVLEAFRANIKELETKKLDAESADIKYANIDFANITEAAIEKLFSDAGIIEDLIMSDGHVTGKLVGVTIIGDLIEGGTVKADKLVVKGTDGLFYKLNFEGGDFAGGEAVPDDGLHGSIIVAKSITAEKVNVDDLVAFDATIGGFNITNEAIYSGVKSSAENTTRGIYMDRYGQLSVGDASNFLRYYKDQNGVYKLEISADSLVFSSGKKSVKEAIEDIKKEIDDLEIGARNLIRNSTNLIFSDYQFVEKATNLYSADNYMLTSIDGLDIIVMV